MKERAYPTPVFDDALDERQRREAEAAKRKEALRQEVRAAFPEVTEFADELKKVFPQTTILWAAEKGNVIGPVPKDERARQEAKFGPLREIGKRRS